MKIDARSTSRTLAEIGKWRGVLLYGDDFGLIRERAAHCVRQVAESLDDPFRVALLDQEQHGRVEEETGALSLIGGRRVVWVRDAQDTLLSRVTAALAIESDTLLVIELPVLPHAPSCVRHSMPIQRLRRSGAIPTKDAA